MILFMDVADAAVVAAAEGAHPHLWTHGACDGKNDGACENAGVVVAAVVA